jgi:formylglycine-generating enzyme required for sulfatase activity
LADPQIPDPNLKLWRLLLDRWRSADRERWRKVFLLLAERFAQRGGQVLEQSAVQWLGWLAMPQLNREPPKTAQERCCDAALAALSYQALGGRPALITTDADVAGLEDKLRTALAAGLAMPEPSVSAADRVLMGALLGQLGDPRPGVCDLPGAFVAFPAACFVIGTSETEYQQIIVAETVNNRGDAAQHWYANTRNDQPVPLRAFALARYPVTNAQYAQFIEAGGYDSAQPWWDTAGRAWLARDDQQTEGLQSWQRRNHKTQPELWSDPRFGVRRPNHPVVGVSWYEASAFCRWLTETRQDGWVYCLPSEAEWEYAARGLVRRIYPWGDDAPNAQRANYDNMHNGTSAVGCFPAGATPEPECILDLAGNVWEWTRSAYASYPYDPDDGREDETDVVEKSFTLRGGSWSNQSFYLRASDRLHGTPDYHFNLVGLRLARHRSV